MSKVKFTQMKVIINKLLKAFCLTALLSIGAFAQTSNSFEDYKKNEYYVGYSNQQKDLENYETFHGFEAAYTRNFNRYFGIKADISGAYKNDNFNVTTTASSTIPGGFTYESRNRRSLYNFLGGVQIKDNASKTRFKPFGHALVGIAYNRNKFNSLACTTTATPCPVSSLTTVDTAFSDTGFSGAFGGGLDIKINDKIDFRAIQIDYNPVHSNTRVENNVRFGIGIVFK